MVQFLVALALIVCGFISAFYNVTFFDKLAPLEWFVAAIAVNTLTVVKVALPRRK
jgi:hypothetical protein